MASNQISKYAQFTKSYQPFGSIGNDWFPYQQRIHINNTSGFPIQVLSLDGTITTIPDMPHRLSPMGQIQGVEIVWEHSAGDGSDFNITRMQPIVPKPQNNQPVSDNRFNIAIRASELVQDVVSVDELGLYITSAANSARLLEYRGTNQNFTLKQIEVLARKYFKRESRTQLEQDLMRVPVAPIVVFANSHDTNLRKLYVSINQMPCEIEICHDTSREESLVLAICRPDGIISTYPVSDFQWSKSNAVTVRAFDYDWIIGTNRSDVSNMCLEIARELNKRKTDTEVDTLIKFKTDKLETEKAALIDDVKALTAENKRLKEQIKELASQLDTAESYTESTVKQRMSYDNMAFNRQKIQHDQWKMEVEQLRASWDQHMQAIKEENARLQAIIADQVARDKAEREQRYAEEKAEREREKAQREQEYARQKAMAEQEAMQRKLEAEERTRRMEEEYAQRREMEARAKAEAEARRTERSGMFDIIKTGLTALSLVISLVTLIYKTQK